MIINDKVTFLSNEIAFRSVREAEYFPVDRKFLNQYLEQIKSVDPVQFIFYNCEAVNQTYSIQLFLCLPEIWQTIKIDDLLEMAINFTNPHSFFIIITFTHKYIGINIIDLLLPVIKSSTTFLVQTLEYLELQWNVLILDPIEREELVNGYLHEYIVFDDVEWGDTKRRLLLDHRVSLADHNPITLKTYIDLTVNRWVG